MAVYQRTSGGPYHVEVEWRGYPRLRAPESYFQEDAAKMAASLSGERNREAEAQAALAREGMRPA